MRRLQINFRRAIKIGTSLDWAHRTWHMPNDKFALFWDRIQDAHRDLWSFLFFHHRFRVVGSRRWFLACRVDVASLTSFLKKLRRVARQKRNQLST